MVITEIKHMFTDSNLMKQYRYSYYSTEKLNKFFGFKASYCNMQVICNHKWDEKLVSFS